jgi:hypothetical protein
MAEGFEPKIPLGHLYTLRDGTRVCLRLARSSDIPAVRELLADRGLDLAALELTRLVHFDPRRRYVVCATSLLESSETLLGLGAIDLEDAAEPDLLVVREGHSSDLGKLLTQALVGAASRLGRSRAA